MFRRKSPKYFRVGHASRKPKVGETVINTISPDRAELEIGGPKPLPRGKLEWDREKKERIRLLRRMNA